jgi:hypothetical protein
MDSPLFPTESGGFPSKAGMVAAYRAVARGMGLDEAEAALVTGHVARCSGAQAMARVGAPLYLIQLFCRWGSNTVLKYVREAPLQLSSSLAEQVAGSLSLEEARAETTFALGIRASRAPPRAVVDRVVGKIMETQAVRDGGIEKLLEIIRTKQEVLEDGLQALLKEFDDAARKQFTPNFVLNASTGVLRSVKSASATHCGWLWQGRAEALPQRELGSHDRCRAPGCVVAFPGRAAPPAALE